MTRRQATAIGFVAILLWSMLALFTVGSAPVPPFLLNVLTFGVGGLVGIVWIMATGGFAQLRGVDWRVYAFGITALFGYHALYFSALRLSPPAEAGLICYPMGGTIDGLNGDHVLLAPPYIIEDAQIDA